MQNNKNISTTSSVHIGILFFSIEKCVRVYVRVCACSFEEREREREREREKREERKCREKEINKQRKWHGKKWEIREREKKFERVLVQDKSEWTSKKRREIMLDRNEFKKVSYILILIIWKL